MRCAQFRAPTAQVLPWQGRIDTGPNWSNAKHRFGNLLVTSSIRSSLVSLSGVVGLLPGAGALERHAVLAQQLP